MRSKYYYKSAKKKTIKPFSKDVIQIERKNADQPLNQAELDFTNVPYAWEQGYTGKGMVIAIIDSGVSVHNDLRLSDSKSAKISKTEAESIIEKKGYGRYVNEKIPFAHNYILNNSDATDPKRYFDYEHGLKVAGCAAANGVAENTNVDGQYIIGPAKDAQILNLKVYGSICNEISYNVAQAIDDAVELGADVINISLGNGVATVDEHDIEQQAINRAVEAGVIVCGSAANSGHAAITFEKISHPEKNLYRNVENSGTVANPGVTPSEITVGNADTYHALTMEDIKMSDSSSWGPTPIYDLKPDISAPGHHVPVLTLGKSGQEDSHEYGSGTSFSGPFIAGCAVLIKQYLQEMTNLSKTDLVQAVKNIMMNKAHLIKNDQILSPRNQGAGLIDMKAVMGQKVIAYGEDDIASLSLHYLNSQTNFKIHLLNLGSTKVIYHTQQNLPVLTSIRNDRNTGDEILTTARISTLTDLIEIEPKEMVEIKFSLNLDENMAKNKLVEGYIKLESDTPLQDITMPFVGYYGDLSDEKILEDMPGFETFFISKDGAPLGIGGREDALLLTENLEKTPDYIDYNKIAFSPNQDGLLDEIFPMIYSKQNVTKLTIDIESFDGKLKRQIDVENKVDKSYILELGGGMFDISANKGMALSYKDLAWDGLFFNQETGLLLQAPEGTYRYTLSVDLAMMGKNQHQEKTFDVIVDTSYPTISNIKFTGESLSLDYADNGSGFTKNTNIWLSGSKGTQPLPLNNDGVTLSGHTTAKLTDEIFQKIGSAPYYISVSDVAGNLTKYGVNDASISHDPDQYNNSEGLMTPGQYPINCHTHYVPNDDYIKFDHLMDNSYNTLNAVNPIYSNGEITIKGSVTDKVQDLTILGASAYENDTNNQVEIHADKSFIYKFKIQAPITKSLGYTIKTTDGQTIYGVLVLIIDVEAPVLMVDQLDGLIPDEDGIYHLETSDSNFTFTGLCNDNAEGMTLSINKNRIYRGYNGGTGGDVNRDNPYGPYSFDYNVELNRGNNYILIEGIDQVENETSLKINIVRN